MTKTKKDYKPRTTVNPVSWSGERILKYQAVCRLNDVAVFGDPMPSEDEARVSLDDKIVETHKAVEKMLKLVEDRKKKVKLIDFE